MFVDVLSIEVDGTQPIFNQLEDIVHKFNEELDGHEKLLQRVERKFENRVLEQVAQRIAIDQVELATILGTLETSINNVVSLFVK